MSNVFPRLHCRACSLVVALVVLGALAACNSSEGKQESSPEKKQEPSSQTETPSGGQEALATEGAEPHADTPASASTRTWSFDDAEAGAIAPGFRGATGQWSVETDSTAPSGDKVLAQKAANGRDTFNVALVEETSADDVDITVRLQAIEGRIDQAGGIVWRARDAQNYYLARWNPLEDNFRVYYVMDGRRHQLQSADVDVDPEGWHTLRVTMEGDHIQGYLDGTRYLDVRDDTFAEVGMVGLWTKADAQTHFDDLTIRALGGGSSALDPDAIGAAAGVDATTTADGVVRVGWSRNDVAVMVDGMPFPAAAGLGSWAAFKATPHGAMVMGDTVVFQDEAGPAMDAAFAHGLAVTALHNHFFFDEPKVYFMHISGQGDAVELARGVGAVWDAIKAVRAERPTPVESFGGPIPSQPGQEGGIDVAAIERIVGHEAQQKGPIVKVTLGREAAMHGVSFGASMGLTTWAAFVGTDELATMDGDFAMTAAEVQPVLRALREAGIHVVALHNHMMGDEPHYYFAHFWGKGPAAELARGFRSALDAQAQASSSGGY